MVISASAEPMAGTGAVVSSINTLQPLSTKSLIIGENQTLSFLYAPECPVNLLGCDLLIKMDITIYCNAQELKLCSTPNKSPEENAYIMYMSLTPDPIESLTKVLWSRLLYPAEATPTVQFTFMEWTPILMSLFPYKEPPNPLHCTYNYVISPDDHYENNWEEQQEGHKEQIK